MSELATLALDESDADASHPLDGTPAKAVPALSAALDPEGLKEVSVLIDYYMENAAMLKQAMLDIGLEVHGGTDAPYVFVDLEGKSSWDTFSELLESSQVVTIPGAGFGPGGEGFLRLSAFAPRAACEEACERLKKAFAGKK